VVYCVTLVLTPTGVSASGAAYPPTIPRESATEPDHPDPEDEVQEVVGSADGQGQTNPRDLDAEMITRIPVAPAKDHHNLIMTTTDSTTNTPKYRADVDAPRRTAETKSGVKTAETKGGG